jgi:hypothetical protein
MRHDDVFDNAANQSPLLSHASPGCEQVRQVMQANWSIPAISDGKRKTRIRDA